MALKNTQALTTATPNSSVSAKHELPSAYPKNKKLPSAYAKRMEWCRGQGLNFKEMEISPSQPLFSVPFLYFMDWGQIVVE